MSINTPSNISAELSIGFTDKSMVRVYIKNDTLELPLDFTPDEAEEIARELQSAAQIARQT